MGVESLISPRGAGGERDKTMRFKQNEYGSILWLSADDTYQWASGETPRGFKCEHQGSWPCSQLRGKRVRVEFEKNGDLVDLAVNGKMADVDVNELDAIVADAVGSAHPEVNAPQVSEDLSQAPALANILHGPKGVR